MMSALPDGAVEDGAIQAESRKKAALLHGAVYLFICNRLLFVWLLLLFLIVLPPLDRLTESFVKCHLSFKAEIVPGS